jgi:hypothetical protein
MALSLPLAVGSRDDSSHWANDNLISFQSEFSKFAPKYLWIDICAGWQYDLNISVDAGCW